MENSDIQELIGAAYRKGAVIGSVCAGPVLLSRAGILDGKKIAHGYTSSQIPWLKEHGHFLRCELSDEKLVVEGKIVTAKPDAVDAFTQAIGRLI
jgi:putative intracellular protease/amidase